MRFSKWTLGRARRSYCGRGPESLERLRRGHVSRAWASCVQVRASLGTAREIEIPTKRAEIRNVGDEKRKRLCNSKWLQETKTVRCLRRGPSQMGSSSNFSMTFDDNKPDGVPTRLQDPSNFCIKCNQNVATSRPSETKNGQKW